MAERTGLEPATPGVTVELIVNTFNNLQRLRTHKFTRLIIANRVNETLDLYNPIIELAEPEDALHEYVAT